MSSFKVDIVVGRDVGLGDEGKLILGDITGLDSLQDKGAIKGGSRLRGDNGMLLGLLFFALKVKGARGSGLQVFRIAVHDLVAEADFQFSSSLLVAKTSAVVRNGSSQETAGQGCIVIRAVATDRRDNDGGLDGKCSFLVHGSVVVGAVSVEKGASDGQGNMRDINKSSFQELMKHRELTCK